MSGIFGILGVNDHDRVFVNTIGQDIVYDAVNELLERYNAELNTAKAFFVEQTTDDFKWRYKLPGGGRLQRLGKHAAPAEVKAYGAWDVAFPLEGFGAGAGGTRIDLAYMSVQELDRHLDTVMIQDRNTYRFEMLRRLFNNTQRTFSDELHGSLAIESLANGDTVTYPPVLGSETEATEDHYYHTGYAAANISDTNNPYATIRDELQEHFGRPEGGSPIVTFINPDEQPETEALTGFVEVEDNWIRPGDDTAVPFNLPSNVPGTIIGRVSSCWVSVWDWIPSGYIYGQHLQVDPPLIERVDPADTNLPRGLTLVAEQERYPLQQSYWEHRFGLGVGNRLNGVFLEFNHSAFSIPTGYTY